MESKEIFRSEMWELSEVVWEMTSRLHQHKKKHPNYDIVPQMKSLLVISKFEMLYYELCFQRDNAVKHAQDMEYKNKKQLETIQEKETEIKKLLTVLENLK